MRGHQARELADALTALGLAMLARGELAPTLGPVARDQQVFPLQLLGGHTGAVVVDDDRLVGHGIGQADAHRLGIGVPGVVHQFLQRSLG
jgi:hypothetical protein